MSKYILSCGSAADLSKQHFEKIDVHYISFSYELDGIQYKDDLGETISTHAFYEKLKNGANAKTSQINPEEYQEYFEQFLSKGKDIFHVCLSSGITGTINSANIAKEILAEKYPDRKIYIVDSLAASSGYGLLMDALSQKRNEGLNIDELFEWVQKNKLNVQHWFFSTDLSFYVKGGRISKGAGFIGNVLSICPLLNVNNEGKLIPVEKIRTKKKAIKASLDKMLQLAQDGENYSGKCFISHSDSLSEAKQLAEIIEDRFPKVEKVEINDIGTTIGSHTGPGTIALFFWGECR